jgi:hypothetical protein
MGYPALHIIGLYAVRRLAAVWPTKNRSRRCTSLPQVQGCVFSPAHFARRWNASHSFIATAKTSYTAGTLDAIVPKIFVKY